MWKIVCLVLSPVQVFCLECYVCSNSACTETQKQHCKPSVEECFQFKGRRTSSANNLRIETKGCYEDYFKSYEKLCDLKGNTCRKCVKDMCNGGGYQTRLPKLLLSLGFVATFFNTRRVQP